ncbi:MAG: 30S ribosomal protein S4 [Thermoplasmata archaeon]|nr:30S ribosomal protein S4 [Thermoplasmata archaeon]
MGDPKFLRRTYDTPKHPWEATRMEEERKLLRKYALKNKRELWKAQSILRGFRRQARDLQARLRAGEPQAKRETEGLLARLTRLGLLPAGAPTLDDVLAMGTDEVLRRRFATVVAEKGLASTPLAARKLIIQGHLAIAGRRMTRPGYLLPSEAESAIAYAPTSPLLDELHPLRVALREKLSAPPREVPSGPPAEVR